MVCANWSLRAASALCRSSGPLSTVPSGMVAGGSMGRWYCGSTVRYAPTVLKFSSAKPSGSITAWQLAQVGLRAVHFRLLAHRGGLALRGLGQVRHIRRRSGRRRAEDAFHDPGAAQHRGGAVRVRGEHQNRALAQQAEAVRILQRHLVEAVAADVLHAVDQRDLLVQVGVVGGEQVRHGAVGAQDAVHEQLELLLERRARVIDAAGIAEERGRGNDAVHLGDVEPLEGEVPWSARSPSGRPSCGAPVPSARRASTARSSPRAASSSSSGRLLHRKKDRREASSRSLSCAGALVHRRLGAVQEVRARQDRRERFAHTGLEAVGLAGAVVEAHQRGDVLVLHRAAEGVLRQVADDLLGAGPLLGGACRLADEDLLAGSANRSCR